MGTHRRPVMSEPEPREAEAAMYRALHARIGRLALALGLVVGTAAPAAAAPLPLGKEEQARVDQAADKAIAFLKGAQAKKGNWEPYAERAAKLFPVGDTVMPALALLEAGVPADDPSIRQAARFLRPYLSNLDKTYELALALLFLERLGDPQDRPVIRTLAMRLVAGQCRSGGWCYRCPTLSAANEEALSDLLGKWGTDGDKAVPVPPQALKVLTLFQDDARLWHDEAEGMNRLFTGRTDNSNTQFAVLALWAARRQGIRTEPALHLAARRFETTQNGDGTWSYIYLRGGEKHKTSSLDPRYRAMTAVGLLGLALRDGLRNEGDAPPAAPDVQILRGFAAMSLYVGEPAGPLTRRPPMTDIYALWSVERLAMLYDLPTIGGKDWYRWGAEILVANQTARGDWPESSLVPQFSCGPNVNAAFGLLFLKRSNLVRDLTAKIPYKPDALEKGVAAALQGKPLPGTSAPSEQSPKKP